MRYALLALLALAAAIAAAAALPLTEPDNTGGVVAGAAYSPSKHLFIDYVADVGAFLQGREDFGELVRNHYGNAYWVKGVVTAELIDINESLATPSSSPQATKASPYLVFEVEDVIKGPHDLVGERILIRDLVTTYEGGKFLFIYDHLPLIPGKTYVLAITPTGKQAPDGYRGIYVANPIMRFLITGDGHVVYLYDRDALYGADPDYAAIINKVTDPVVLTYTGNDPYLTGKANYEEFRSWLVNEIGP